MPSLDAINTAVYKLLKGDEILGGICTVYKGTKRPGNSTNPSVTIDSKHLERGEGEGIWMCDVVITTFTDVLANRMADHDKIDTIVSRVSELLSDTEIELEGSKALPLIEGESTVPAWLNAHDDETFQESTFGLIFIDFGSCS